MDSTPDDVLPIGAFHARHSSKDKSTYSLAQSAFTESTIPLLEKLEAFPRFATKRSMARFLVKLELYKRIINTTGIVVECGVLNGAGLFTWAQLSNIFEPVNHTRKIVGFDTFEGFPSIDPAIDNAGLLESKVGDLRGSSFEELSLAVEKFNGERSLSHIPLVHLVKGDFLNTSKTYLEKNSQTIVSLLYLDFDLYEPTRVALERFLPLMPKGAIVAFDELNCESFPGETKALDHVMGIKNYAIQRFPWDPWISYIQL